LDQISPI